MVGPMFREINYEKELGRVCVLCVGVCGHLLPKAKALGCGTAGPGAATSTLLTSIMPEKQKATRPALNTAMAKKHGATVAESASSAGGSSLPGRS